MIEKKEELQKSSVTPVVPSEEAVLEERNRLQQQRKFWQLFRTTIHVLIVVAAISILTASVFLPVLQISGSSMEPTLSDDDVVVLWKSNHFETGDLVGFYFQNKLLLKRVIAGPGDMVDIDAAGNVYVNDEQLEESYLAVKSMGESDLDYPYQVPENRYFVMGDNRTTSIDSRSSVIGCIEVEQIVGKVFLRVWPIRKLSLLN